MKGTLQTADNVVSLPEFSCWDSENRFRQSRGIVWFRLWSYGTLNGVRVDCQFPADFGLFYDHDSEYLYSILYEIYPEIQWRSMRFFYKMDFSSVRLYDADNREIGQISVRGRRPKGRDKYEVEEFKWFVGKGGNPVTSMEQFKRERESREGKKVQETG